MPSSLQLQGKPENFQAAQEALLKRAKANSDAQLGQYDPSNETAEAGERTYEKGYKVGGAEGVRGEWGLGLRWGRRGLAVC